MIDLECLLDDLARRIAALIQPVPGPQKPLGPLGKRDAAQALGISETTLGRLVRAGILIEGRDWAFQGARRFFAVDQCRQTLAEKGRTPTTPSGQPDPEIARLARAAGLRVV